ncbi:MAG TPA: hypothetical protein VHV57_11225 [Acidimicrobiales bacterium]|jgi:hypothetical protein|nr:hypothetical protein [Acidimicrobiales bacterium]
MRFNSSSLTQTDRIVGTATIVLFIALFLPWFSVNIGIGTVSADGLSAHGYLYLTLFLSLGVIGMLVASATGAWSLPATSPIAREQLLLIATAINFVLVLLGFVLKPGGSGVGWTFGAFIALAAAVVAAAPLGLPAIRARRGK